jgi:glyoxylase-like metal-dependent hydrolase (beta-lactamase superfamily II)
MPALAGRIGAAAELAHPPEWIAEGGLLPGALAAAGVGPADINTVFLTHLHADHISWVAPGGELFFPNAEVVYGAADAQPPIAPALETEPSGHARSSSRPSRGRNISIGMTHFPGLEFQRIATQDGRHWTAA